MKSICSGRMADIPRTRRCTAPGRLVWPALLLAAHVATPAATYKCTVDGKTTYQQSPCGNAAQGGSERLEIRTPPPGGGMSAEQVQKVTKSLKDAGPRIAQDAFENLVAGRIDVYVANLCPNDRKSFGNPTIKQSLKLTGANLAQRKTKLGMVTDSSTNDLSFMAIDDPFANRSDGKPPKRQRVVAHFGQDLGQWCLRAMSISEN